MATQRTMWIWVDTIVQRPCRGTSCRKTIWMAQNCKTGNYMPFNVPPAALATQRELETNRESILVDMKDVHWEDCGQRTAFRRRGRR